MSLFKYLPPSRIDVFDQCRIRFSQPAAFNDPFEGKPDVTGIAPTSWWEATYPGRFDRLLREQYASLSSKLKAEASLEDFLVQFEPMRSEIYQIFNRVHASAQPEAAAIVHDNFGTKIGVLSLTEIKDSILMWAHYAESHTGYVIEFDDAHPFLSEHFNNVDHLWRLHKIQYATERPMTTLAELDIEKIILTKSKSWEYEREWRLFKPLMLASKTILADPLPICLFDFPPELVKSVVLGARMSTSTRIWFQQKMKTQREYQHVNLFCAELDPKKYELVFKPVSLN